jgi:hypothetical protein
MSVLYENRQKNCDVDLGEFKYDYRNSLIWLKSFLQKQGWSFRTIPYDSVLFFGLKYIKINEIFNKNWQKDNDKNLGEYKYDYCSRLTWLKSFLQTQRWSSNAIPYNNLPFCGLKLKKVIESHECIV